MKMKGTLVNHSEKKILGFAWRKLCNWIKAEVGRVVGYGLDQLPTVGFKSFRLSWFASNPKLVCEKMGSGSEAGPRVFSDPGSISLHEDAVGPQARLVSSPSTVEALSSFATGDFEVQQSGSSQVRSAFASGCVLAPAVLVDFVLVSVLEDVAQPSLRRAREGRAVHLDESLFAETVAAMRIDIVGETKSLQHSKVEDPSKAVSMKAVVKQSSPVRGFLRRGFLNRSVQSTLSLKVLVASSSTLVAKEVGVEGTPSLLGGCGSPNVEKDEDFGFNGLIESQKWPLGYGLDGESIVWDHGDKIWYGEDGESIYPLGVLHPNMPLDWVLDGDEGEDPSLAILDVIDEEFHQKTMVACQNTKGMGELLKLKSSINYGDASAPFWRWK
jgi:hypothetical protein